LLYLSFDIVIYTQERLDEMIHVSSSLTKVLGSNSALDIQQR